MQITEVFTYYPFADANCGKDFGEVANLGKVTAIEKYFSNKQPNRMKNCTVKVVMQETIPYVNLGTSHHDTYDKHMEGIDQYVLNIMAKIEDVTLDYIVPSTETSTLGFVLPNGTVTDQLAYLQNGSADIAIGGYILIENQAEHFDYIWGYKYASYYLFTPAKSNDNWKDIYEEFSLTTWILIISAYWLIVAVCLMVLQLPPAIKHSRLNIMLVLWGFYLWNCNKRILQIKRLRLILIWWIWYTFFVVNFYTSYLYSLIASYNQKPANIDENNLNSSKLKPCISSNVRASYLYSHNISFPENVDLPACKHSGSALKAVAENDNLFTIQRHYHYLANEFKFYDDNHYRKLDLKRIGNTMNVVMYTNRGFPLQNQMKLHGTRIFETGIVDKHLEILIHTNKTVSKKAVTKYSKLSMPDLRISFWILLLGIIISLLCFLLEFVI
ncbi:uncharacterized protein LOC128200614, partial [Galleria mellonella]|uniref:Uncharacterized protein LOC128200614 n=1 Tax=Galleria mellonella TaxID=7137 RepID=A0ABM3MGR6_GALME